MGYRLVNSRQLRTHSLLPVHSMSDDHYAVPLQIMFQSKFLCRKRNGTDCFFFIVCKFRANNTSRRLLCGARSERASAKKNNNKMYSVLASSQLVAISSHSHKIPSILRLRKRLARMVRGCYSISIASRITKDKRRSRLTDGRRLPRTDARVTRLFVGIYTKTIAVS